MHEYMRVGSHLICRCFEFGIGHPPNHCATDGHGFRDLSWSKEQLPVFYTMLSLFKSNIFNKCVCMSLCMCVPD